MALSKLAEKRTLPEQRCTRRWQRVRRVQRRLRIQNLRRRSKQQHLHYRLHVGKIHFVTAVSFHGSLNESYWSYQSDKQRRPVALQRRMGGTLRAQQARRWMRDAYRYEWRVFMRALMLYTCMYAVHPASACWWWMLLEAHLVDGTRWRIASLKPRLLVYSAMYSMGERCT